MIKIFRLNTKNGVNLKEIFKIQKITLNTVPEPGRIWFGFYFIIVATKQIKVVRKTQL